MLSVRAYDIFGIEIDKFLRFPLTLRMDENDCVKSDSMADFTNLSIRKSLETQKLFYYALEDLTTSRSTQICDHDISRPSASELVSYVDRYLPESSSSYGGALPLSQYHQLDVLIVRSSHQWRNNRFCLPKRKPCFEVIDSILQSEINNKTNP